MVEPPESRPRPTMMKRGSRCIPHDWLSSQFKSLIYSAASFGFFLLIAPSTDERSEEDGSRVEEVCGPCSERFGDGRLVKPASQIVFFWCSEFRVDIQAQIAFGKNNPSSILNLTVGSRRYKKILCNHLQFIKYFVIFYTLSLQSDSHFPWMVLLPDEVLWSHLALPEKLRWSHSYNLGSVISMSTKSDPKYASFEFSSLQNKGVLSKIPPFWRLKGGRH